MFIEDGFDYHIKIAVEEWAHEHGFYDAEDAIVEFDGTSSVRQALERALLDRAEAYRDVNAVIRAVIEDRKARANK